jgi:hypothetical protein
MLYKPMQSDLAHAEDYNNARDFISVTAGHDEEVESYYLERAVLTAFLSVSRQEGALFAVNHRARKLFQCLNKKCGRESRNLAHILNKPRISRLGLTL